MHHLKSLAVSYKLLIINNSILSQQKSDEVGTVAILFLSIVHLPRIKEDDGIAMGFAAAG